MSLDYEKISNAYVTIGGVHLPVLKIFETIEGVHTKVYPASSPYAVVIYNANGGVFDNGKTTNTVEYNIVGEITTVTKISKTSNVSDDGLTADTSTGYGNSKAITDVVTIDGAESLDITITYQTESTSYDWVCIYDDSVTPSTSNYGSSITGKLGGTTKTTKTYTINGDTAQFYFESDSSVCNYYGYYAVITGESDSTTITIVSGEEKEPSNEELYFDGWYLDLNCTVGNKFNLKQDIQMGKEINVYAKWLTEEERTLQDFEYIKNNDGTVTLTAWKGTLNGEPSTELVIPDNDRIIL